MSLRPLAPQTSAAATLGWRDRRCDRMPARPASYQLINPRFFNEFNPAGSPRYLENADIWN